jgi:ABC-2 type transport system ATP-binding protein
MESIISLKEISKSYQGHQAVKGVSFEIKTGSIFGLLGPNGAGKTSIIRIISRIIHQDSGDLFFKNSPLLDNDRHFIGYMPEERGLYKKMKVGEHLIYLARLKGLSANDASTRVKKWMAEFEMNSWWNKKIEELSKGMQQKIQFIATVVHEPELLILDEPFSGLDPINSNLIKDKIFELNKKGVTILFSTHRMEQVEEICQEIVLMNLGSKILEGEVAEIKNRFKKNMYRIETATAFDEELPFETVQRNSNEMVVHIEDENQSNRIPEFFITRNIRIKSFEEILPSINEIFIQQVKGN